MKRVVYTHDNKYTILIILIFRYRKLFLYKIYISYRTSYSSTAISGPAAPVCHFYSAIACMTAVMLPK